MKQNYKTKTLIAKISTLFLLFFLMLGINQALVAEEFDISIDTELQTITFNWSEPVGTFSGSFFIDDQPFNTDGGFFLIRLFDKNDNLLVFSDIFDEFSVGAINYHASDVSKRLFADFTGAQFDGIWGTTALSDNPDYGNSLRGTDFNGSLFYGVMFENPGMGFGGLVLPGAGEETMPYQFKANECTHGDFRIEVSFYQPFRPGADVGQPTAEYHATDAFGNLEALATAEIELNITATAVRNLDREDLCHPSISEVIGDLNTDSRDLINIPSGTYDETVTDYKGLGFILGDQTGDYEFWLSGFNQGTVNITGDLNLSVEPSKEPPPQEDLVRSILVIQLFNDEQSDKWIVEGDVNFNEETVLYIIIEDDANINPGDKFTIMEYYGERFGKFEYIIAFSSAFMPRIGLEDFRVTSNLIQTFGNDSLFFVIDYGTNPDKSGGAITLTAVQKAFEMIINPQQID